MNTPKVQHSLLVDVSHLNISIEQQIILQDVHLKVHRDEIVTLIGPNGAGKSTLVKAVLGLITPNSGVVYKRPGLRMGYMPQKLLIEPYMPLSVLRFLELAPLKSSLKDIIEELGIKRLLSSPMQAISGGEAQRVLLARALLSHPELLVLDEPAQGVDVVGQQELYQLIIRIRDRWRCGILMVSHDLHMVMAGTDSVICLNKHVCCSGLPGTVSQHPEFIKLFGEQEPLGLAMYTHSHNHRHDDLGGDGCP
jgi:zinc transport system ATP-binding protein